MDVTITGVVFNAYGQRITGAQTVTDDFGAALIQSGRAVVASTSIFPPVQNTLYGITPTSPATTVSVFEGTSGLVAVSS